MRCTYCDGTGIEYEEHDFGATEELACPWCQGVGAWPDCRACDASRMNAGPGLSAARHTCMVPAPSGDAGEGEKR